jgi:hypothetical protein
VNPGLIPRQDAASLMTNRMEQLPSSRRLACASCGAEFGCNPSGPCWCSDEAFRMPMPVDGSDCLCPDCLRKLAEQHTSAGAA